MNILFFLTPKIKVAYLESDNTIRQAAEKMYHYSYTNVPVLDNEGHFVRVVSEGDIFRYLMNHKGNLQALEKPTVMDLDNERIFKPIHHNANIEDLLDVIQNQNFVPVVDDRNLFIGIVTRRAVIEHVKKIIKSDEE